MLQTRRRPAEQILSLAGSSIGALWDRLVASDPGLIRLMLAVRGTGSVVLCTLAAIVAGKAMHTSPVEFASGVTFGLMSPFLIREPRVRQRLVSLLTLTLPAAAATVATALLHGRGPAGDACFLALVFLCFLFHPRHPRMVGVGLVAIVVTYVGLYLELPPATVPWQLLSIVAAVPIVAFVCFVLVPMNPATTLRLTVASIQRRAAQVLMTAREAAGQANHPHASAGRLGRDLARLNEAALVADDLLALLQPGGRDAIRMGLFDLELATARLIGAMREETPGPRSRVRLRLHERRISRGQAYAMHPWQTERGTLRAALVDLGRAAHVLRLAARTMVPERNLPPAPELRPSPLGWRIATRVTAAAALAMAGGMALSPDRWFWAVMTVYVVFLNARSRGDTIYKGVQRLGGTLLGIVSGLVLATMVAGNEGLQTVALILSVFGMYYLFLSSYTAGIFCVTVMLGLLYGMMGASLETLLVLRLEETAIGAAAAILVAAFVLPTRTRNHVLTSGRGVLNSLVQVLRSCRSVMSGVPGTPPVEAMRQVDRQVADLRLALAPLTAGRSMFRRSSLERPVPVLLECVHWTRVLAVAVRDCQASADGKSAIAQLAGIEARVAALAGLPVDIAAPVPQAARAPVAEGAVPGEMQAALNSLDACLDTLAIRLKLGALEGFTLAP